jgi:hypothetical protein
VQAHGQEWRFLKRALNVWLWSGRSFREMHGIPPWIFDSPFAEDLAHMILLRVRSELAAERQTPTKPGSKAAVRQHFGVWEDDPTPIQIISNRARPVASKG